MQNSVHIRNNEQGEALKKCETVLDNNNHTVIQARTVEILNQNSKRSNFADIPGDNYTMCGKISFKAMNSIQR
jgi:hypothetical protein